MWVVFVFYAACNCLATFTMHRNTDNIVTMNQPLAQDLSENDPSRPRVVLLGASNLTRSISTIVGTIQHLLADRLDTTASDWFVAYGHGRSFGRWSSIVTRALPGICDCGLWDDLDKSVSIYTDDSGQMVSSAPVYALLTDVGNDIPFGVEPDVIADWVTDCIDRLRAKHAKIIMTGLPTAALDASSPMIGNVLRRVFFPSCTLNRIELLDRARCVHVILREIAESKDIPFIEMPLEWYGIDPIHIRRGCCKPAWLYILSHWFQNEVSPDILSSEPIVYPSMRRWLYWRTRQYAHVSIAGSIVRSAGPAGYDRQSKNAKIWLY